jgi:hypothetical protein
VGKICLELRNLTPERSLKEINTQKMSRFNKERCVNMHNLSQIHSTEKSATASQGKFIY